MSRSLSPFEPRLLSESEWARLQALADQFEIARQRGTIPEWSPYLPPAGDSLRLPVLYELIAIDLDAEWRNGNERLLEWYAERFPEIGAPAALPAQLILEEFRTRRLHAVAPTPEEYRSRFPARAAELQSMLGQLPVPTMPDSAQHTRPSGLPSAVPSAPNSTPHQVPFSGAYRLLELIGRGNFGEVWRGESPSGIPVAVKVLNKRADKEIDRREVTSLELIKRLRHGALLATLDYWTHEDRLYIAMELADGTLRDRLRECRKKGQQGISGSELLPWFRDAADGLDYLHSQRVLHRDVKPDNIVLVHGRAKLADFGLARLQDRTLTSVSFAGTPLFMAPEVWEGKANAHSDQYSLAFTYAELRLGRRPISGSELCEAMKNTLEGQPNLDGLPRAEAQIIQRALAKLPDERFANCREFVAALERAVQGGVTRPANLPDTMPSPPTHARTGARRVGWPGVLAVIAVALIAAVLGIGWPMNRQPHREPVGANKIPIHGDLYDSEMNVVLPSGQRLAFLLVVPANDANVKPFYLMKTKAPNFAYDEFSAQTRFLGQFRKRLRVFRDPADGPVVDIPAEAAHACAVWIRGRLPKPEELDCACGYTAWDGATRGPKLGGAIAVSAQTPWPLTKTHGDVIGGIQYLFSNGREFTNRVYVVRNSVEETREFPLIGPADINRDQVVLRGWGWQEPLELTYYDMASTSYASSMKQGYREASPYTSFRVVIELSSIASARP